MIRIRKEWKSSGFVSFAMDSYTPSPEEEAEEGNRGEGEGNGGEADKERRNGK